jgi:hypothetical protein
LEADVASTVHCTICGSELQPHCGQSWSWVTCNEQGCDARDFDALIDQLTSGLVDVAANRHNDGTNKFEDNTTAENKVRGLGRDPTYEDRERAKVTAKNSSWDDIKPLKVEGW